MSDLKALGLMFIAAVIVWVAWYATNALAQYLVAS
jgi:hypothetical protein